MYAELFLLSLLSFANGQLDDQEKVCGKMKVHCLCEIGENRHDLLLEIEKYMIRDPETGEMKCSRNSDPYQACASYTCNASESYRLHHIENDSGTKLGHIIASLFPQVFTIPRGDFPGGHRYTRKSEPCHVPTLKYADIKCWKWPNWINCDIHCLHGYALQGPNDTTKSTNVNCRLSENEWKPDGFPDCEPYLNCKVHLIKPGDLKCKDTVGGLTYCDISCFDYEQYEESAVQKYECLDENFARKLPHCAAIQNDVQLIKKPKNVPMH